MSIFNQRVNRFQKGHPIPFAPGPLKELPTISTNLVSPCIGKQNGVPAPLPLESKESIEQLEDLVKVRLEVTRNKYPDWFFEKHNIDPEIPNPIQVSAKVSRYNPQALANLVHMDDPLELGLALRSYAQREDIPLKTPPNHTGKQFRARIISVLPTLASYVNDAMELGFDAKYYYLWPRPEERLGLPGNIITAYEEGCPNHPAFPAGHGTAAGATYRWFKDMYNATPEQLKVVEMTTKHWATYRTIAGVHIFEDNIVGWKLGNGEFN